jgi:3-keto steroid reductase
MSSHQASGDAHDPEDWQVVHNPKPYEATKFQIDLIRAELSRRVGPSASIRYFTVDPGVVDSSMHTALDAGIKFYIKMITFYIVRPFVSFCFRREYADWLRWLCSFSQARLFGSLEHNISAWNGAAATIYVCLAPLAFIPIFLSAAGTPIAQADQRKDGVLPLRMHSQTNLMGRNTIAAVPFYTWPEYEKEASRLVGRCERLYQSFLTAGGKTPQLRD